MHIPDALIQSATSKWFENWGSCVRVWKLGESRD